MIFNIFRVLIFMLIFSLSTMSIITIKSESNNEEFFFEKYKKAESLVKNTNNKPSKLEKDFKEKRLKNLKGENLDKELYISKIEFVLIKIKNLKIEKYLFGILFLGIVLLLLLENPEKRIFMLVNTSILIFYLYTTKYLLILYQEGSNIATYFNILDFIIFYTLTLLINKKIHLNKETLFIFHRKLLYQIKFRDGMALFFVCLVLFLIKVELLTPLSTIALANNQVGQTKLPDLYETLFHINIIMLFIFSLFSLIYKHINLKELEKLDFKNIDIRKNSNRLSYFNFFLYEKGNDKAIFETIDFEDKNHEEFLLLNKKMLTFYLREEKKLNNKIKEINKKTVILNIYLLLKKLKSYDSIFLKLKKIEDLINEDFKRKNELENFKNV